MKVEIKKGDMLVIPGLGRLVGVADVCMGHPGSMDEPPEEASVESVELTLACGEDIPDDKLEALFEDESAYAEVERVVGVILSSVDADQAKAESVRLEWEDRLDDALARGSLTIGLKT